MFELAVPNHDDTIAPNDKSLISIFQKLFFYASDITE